MLDQKKRRRGKKKTRGERKENGIRTGRGRGAWKIKN